MEKIYIGTIVGTHGIKGELRIKSSFDHKDKVFKINNKLLIDDKEYIIRSYRVHKDFDMVTLDDYNDINDVLFLKGKKVYFNKDNLKLSNDEYILEDLLNYKVIYNNSEYKVKNINDANKNNIILYIGNNDDNFKITMKSPSISLDNLNKIIYINGEEGIIR